MNQESMGIEDESGVTSGLMSSLSESSSSELGSGFKDSTVPRRGVHHEVTITDETNLFDEVETKKFVPCGVYEKTDRWPYIRKCMDEAEWHWASDEPLLILPVEVGEFDLPDHLCAQHRRAFNVAFPGFEHYYVSSD